MLREFVLVDHTNISIIIKFQIEVIKRQEPVWGKCRLPDQGIQGAGPVAGLADWGMEMGAARTLQYRRRRAQEL
jgi:hypothetical protein